MSQRPDKIDWSDTDAVEPSGSKKATGFLQLEKPPYQYFQWFWNLVSLIQFYVFGQSQEYIVISSDADEQDYATLAAYIADSPAAGDKVLVKETQVLTAQMVIPDNITLRILDGVNFTRSTLDAASVIKLGDGIIIEGVLNLVLSQTGTTAKAIEINGDNNLGDISVENSSTGIVTDAITLNAGVKGNKVNAIIDNTGAGAIANIIRDDSLKATNDLMIRDIENDAIIALHSHSDENLLINGNGILAQRIDTPYTLVKDVYDFGACDRFEGMATGTAVSAGTLTQTESASIGITGFAHKFVGVTITGAGIIYHRTRIKSEDAKKLKNQISSLACKVNHDVGSPITYTLFVRKANAENDFSAVTEISNDGGISVASGTPTELPFPNISMGDCSNGIEIELKIECGAITTKDFECTDYQLEKGSINTNFKDIDEGIEFDRSTKYFERLIYDSATNEPIASGYADTTTIGFFVLIYNAKRAAPTISSTAFETFLVTRGGVDLTVDSAIGFDRVGTRNLRVTATMTAGLDIDEALILARDSTDTCYIDLNSEL